MLSIQHLTITSTSDLRILVKDLSFAVSPDSRIALIGEEGDGKSTLLQLIHTWPEIPGHITVSGQIIKSGETTALLTQDLPVSGNCKVYDFCQTYPAFAEASWTLLAETCRMVGLNVDLPFRQDPISVLSGGEKVKLRLMLLLLSSPSLLLLDEPSNDLDMEALSALDTFLNHSSVPVLYVSHDEILLRHTANAILHLESVYGKAQPRWTFSRLSYETYVENRTNALAYQEQQYQRETREKRERDTRMKRIEDAVAHAQSSISRRDPHGGRLLKKKMKAVKSLEHRFEREDREATERPNVEWAIDAAWGTDIPELPNGKTVLSLSVPELTAGNTVLARSIELMIRGPEHVFIVGSNGSGKTTLMRHILREFENRNDVKVGYMPQQYEDLLDPDCTPIDFLHTNGSKEQLTELRIHLGAFRFTREEMMHPIRSLSGGQKAKLLLLKLILDRCNVLLLDEPTRNLSPLSAPVLRDMIHRFPGCILCVTHDRVLLSETSGRILRLTCEGLQTVSPNLFV